MIASVRRSTWGLLLLLPACFTPSVPVGDSDGSTDSGTGATSGTGSETAETDASTSSSTGAATGAETGSSSSTGASGLPPEIVSFTANGETDFQGLFAQGVDLELEATDPDGEVVRAEFFVDGESLSAQEGPGPWSTEWLISGAIMNGSRDLRAQVEDNDGNITEANLVAVLDMPNGGFTDQWEDQGGFSYAVATDREGSIVVGTGIEQPLIDEGGEIEGQVLRMNDGPWAASTLDHDYIADAVFDPSGDIWLVAATPVGSSTDTSLIRLNEAGSLLNTFTIDAGQDTPADGLDTPISLSRLGNGDFIVQGSYVPSDGAPDIGSYVMRVTPGGETTWLLRITEDAAVSGGPFVNEAVVGDEIIHLAGSRNVGGSPQAWFGSISSDGEVLDQATISDFTESHAYAVGAAPDGRVALSGTQRDSNTGSWNRWLRVLDDGGEVFSVESTVDGSFGHAIGFDDFGNVISVSTESCEFDLEDFSFGRCSIRVHKYDSAGELLWVAAGLGGAEEFNGPVLFSPGIQADLVIDRYGYVYMSGLHRVPSPVRGDWWVGRLNP